MGEFFRGWRRKAGCVTLVMACIFVGAWARSLGTFDVINFPLGRDYAIAITSWENSFAVRIGWDQEDSWDELIWVARDYDYFGYTDPKSTFYRFKQPIPDGSGCFVSWYLLSSAGGIGVTPNDQTSDRRMLFVIAPYWPIVLPMTLLSAYLLLFSKRRSTTSMKTNDPEPAEAT